MKSCAIGIVRAMAPLRSTCLALLAAAGGCTGQTVVGRWTGAFPLEGARACELRLLDDRGATVQCDGAAIVGAGRYDWDGSRLTLRLSVLTYDGHKVRPPEPLVFSVRGEGNALKADKDGQPYEWRRTMR